MFDIISHFLQKGENLRQMWLLPKEFCIIIIFVISNICIIWKFDEEILRNGKVIATLCFHNKWTNEHTDRQIDLYVCRRCQVCGSGDVEDEFHFVFKCEAYADIRHVYIKSYYYRRPSVMKFISLFNSTNTSVLHKLAIFIKKAYII